MIPYDFLLKWRDVELKERSASQSHFNDLCALLGVENPISADPHGKWFTFEKGATKSGGGAGWADVWRNGCFAWEYKGRHANLDNAYRQLLQYAVALENPPLLIVSDMHRIIVRTNWTNTVQEEHKFEFESLIDGTVRDRLKDAFTDPERFKPHRSRQELTEDTASEFARLAQRLRDRDHEAHQVAHFITRLVFCMFAENVGLLPDKIFRKMLEVSRRKPSAFAENARTLFRAMARPGGKVGFTSIEWFNGSLFEDDQVLPVTSEDIDALLVAASLDWSQIDPSILGTLFERGLDPGKRSQLGAHYTDHKKIMMVVGPTVIQPLQALWADAMARMTSLLENAPKPTKERLLRGAELGKRTRATTEAVAIHSAFIDMLTKFRVLDPACGSGNFLYVALRALKDIEHRANLDIETLGLPRGFPRVGPECVLGIEINPYAAELARISVWIGEIQWMRRNGFDAAKNPVLRPLDTIECRDALLNEDGSLAAWPASDVIVSNPPFLGDKKMIRELGASYTAKLRSAYSGLVPGGANLVCYWLERTRAEFENATGGSRAGFVTTNAIRTGVDRRVLELLCKPAEIYNAWSDEPWVVEGASVRVSIVCVARHAREKHLNGEPVETITSSLSQFSHPLPSRLAANRRTSFTGTFLNGPFEISEEIAEQWLRLPLNVNGRPNSDVIKPTANGQDLVQRGPRKWVIDFGADALEEEAAYYEAPFEYATSAIKPYRQRKNEDGEFVVRRRNHREKWWIHAEARPGMRTALESLTHFTVTPMVSSTRVFCHLDRHYLPNQKLVVFPKEDWCFLGILSSSLHEFWTLEYCSWIGAGNDPTYATKSVYLTFPFPDGLTPDLMPEAYAADPRAQAISTAARRLSELRENWLNPDDFVMRQADMLPGYPDRIVPRDAEKAEKLKKRTLTNLYNLWPQWLANAHAVLDQSVAEAYGWGDDWRAGAVTSEEGLARLFRLNQARAG